jgi:hypothetical protein
MYIKNNKVYDRKSNVPDDMFDPMLKLLINRLIYYEEF